jgi:hypothetical protein
MVLVEVEGVRLHLYLVIHLNYQVQVGQVVLETEQVKILMDLVIPFMVVVEEVEASLLVTEIAEVMDIQVL